MFKKLKDPNLIYSAYGMWDELEYRLSELDLVYWNEDIRSGQEREVYSAPSLYKKIKSIMECNCDEEMMAMLGEIMKRIEYTDSSALDERPSSRFKGDLTLNSSLGSNNLAAQSAYKFRLPDNLSATLPEEESRIDYDTNYPPFDYENPIYGKYILPCHIPINGNIYCIDTDDILTVDNIDDLGASYFMTIDGAPPFTISNETITFITDNAFTYLYINLSDDVISYLRSSIHQCVQLEPSLRGFQLNTLATRTSQLKLNLNDPNSILALKLST